MKDFFVTVDVDWAPDFMLQKVFDLWNANRVPVTFFLTHKSELVLKHASNFEEIDIGVHPDFTFKSKQGRDVNSIFEFFLDFCSPIRSVRSHGNLISTNLLIDMQPYCKSLIDSSTILPRNASISLSTFWHSNVNMRILPYNWEDSHEMQAEEPIFTFEHAFWSSVTGITTLNFHPVHIYLDTLDLNVYKKCKERFGKLESWNKDQLDEYLGFNTEEKEGPISQFFKDALQFKKRFFNNSRLMLLQ